MNSLTEKKFKKNPEKNDNDNLIILYSNVLYMAFRKKINLNRLAKI